MSRSKKIDMFSDFEEILGKVRRHTFSLRDERLSTIKQLDKTVAEPCALCGRYPLLHIVNFNNRRLYPNNVYISCHCGNGDGKWYANGEDALEEWNSNNRGSKPRDPKAVDVLEEFAEEFMRGFRLVD